MQDERIDASLLALLCEEPGPWQMAELERGWRSGLTAVDSVGRLVATGLAHRIEGGFVFASAAGRQAHRLAEAR